MAVRDVVQAAAGQGGGDKLYVEDVFSTYLYDANLSSGVVVNNGINLLDEGGLIWTKCRNFTADHGLYDSERTSFQKLLRSNTTIQELNSGTHIQATTTGYTIDSTGYPETNNNNTGAKHASWTFRKAPSFFDVVTYTGNGATNRTISHNLGSAPGCIVVKATSTTGAWFVYHRSLTVDPTFGPYRLQLNSTAAQVNNDEWGTAPTSTVFTVNNGNVNGSGVTYVAYLFAHDAGGFGDDGEQNVISCGSYTATGNDDIELGFEPQWILHKRANTDSAWYIQDVQRGMALTESKHLSPNTATAEGTFSGNITSPTATGFHNGLWGSGTIIYIAIRRGPMKTPESGTEVFATTAYQGDNSSTRVLQTGFPVDLTLNPTARTLTNSDKWQVFTRLLGTTRLRTTDTSAEQAATTNIVRGFDDNTGLPIGNSGDINGSYAYVNYSFRRAPSFMDVVAYTGTSVARTVNHNLGVAPELMIIKNRTSNPLNQNWFVYAAPIWGTDGADILRLNSNIAPTSSNSLLNNTQPTDLVFSLSDNSNVNYNTANYIAYLFASCPGVSKVGSYTGTGTTQTINCGFSSGARFVLIKRTDSSGDWYIWDSVRGIVTGNDPYLLLNSTAAEVTSTDYIDPVASGFEISSLAPAAINASGGTFIFLAIA